MHEPILEKAVILARGLGTRMTVRDDVAALDDRQVAMVDTGVKALSRGPAVPRRTAPALVDAGCSRVCLVVAPQHEVIEDYYCRQADVLAWLSSSPSRYEPRGPPTPWPPPSSLPPATPSSCSIPTTTTRSKPCGLCASNPHAVALFTGRPC